MCLHAVCITIKVTTQGKTGTYENLIATDMRKLTSVLSWSNFNAKALYILP